MVKQRTIAGYLVLQEEPARELARYKVVLCKMPISIEATEEKDTYVVWYIDPKDKPFDGRFFKARGAAQAEFKRRT